MSGFIWDPAWRDERLAAACTDVRAGIVGAAREVLAETRLARDFARRAYASALLGSLAAGGNLADLWLKDDRKNPDALLLAARTKAAVAAMALRVGSGTAQPLVSDAMTVLGAAMEAWPADPTPWVVMLGLVKYHRSNPVIEPAIRSVSGLAGPWDLLERGIWPRDPFNREAGRHLLDYFGPRCGGRAADAATIAAQLAHGSPENSPLRLLSFAARIEAAPDAGAEAAEKAERFNRVEQIRALIAMNIAEIDAIEAGSWVGERGRPPPDPADLRERIGKLRRVVAHEESQLAADPRPISRALGDDLTDLYAHWFLTHGGLDPKGSAGYIPLADVSLLAYGLHLAGENGCAAVVFRHLQPYASRYPWSLYGDPAQVLQKTLTDIRGGGA